MMFKIVLILVPHLTCNLILPCIGIACLSCHHLTSSQLPSRLLLSQLEINFNIVNVIILVDLLRVILPDEVVKGCKPRWNKGLNAHVIVCWNAEDSKALLEDAKDLLNDIAS